MLNRLSQNSDTDIKEALNTPKEDEDIITACDSLITSLEEAERNAKKMIKKLKYMKNKFS